MADKTIPLSRKYDHGSKPFSEVVIREPKLNDRMAIGPLIDVQRGIVITDDERLWKYAERLLVEPSNFGALGPLDLVDAEALEGAVTDFFMAARASYVSRMSSSSGSDGTPQPSKT